MAENSKIEWTTATLNAIVGCRKVSPGCENCYAIREARRLQCNPHPAVRAKFLPVVQSNERGMNWTGKITFSEDALLAPLKRKKPTTYFVNSLSDLFYEEVSDEIIDKHFAVFALCPQHTFQILTKRPERMRQYLVEWPEGDLYDRTSNIIQRMEDHGYISAEDASTSLGGPDVTIGWKDPTLPLPNVWLGVSVEDQATADERIPLLLDTPAAVRWISAEPLLGPINFVITDSGRWHYDCLEQDEEWRTDRILGPLNWVVVGGESGPNARPCDISHIRSIVEQCKAAGVPVFCKQLGGRPIGSALDEGKPFPITVEMEWTGHGVGSYAAKLKDRKGGSPEEWPDDLRVRQFPEVANV